MRLSAQQSQASRNLQDLVVRGRLATQTQREYDRELRTAQRDFNTLNQRITAADRAVGRFNRNVGNYPMQAVRGLKDLLGAFGFLADDLPVPNPNKSPKSPKISLNPSKPDVEYVYVPPPNGPPAPPKP